MIRDKQRLVMGLSAAESEAMNGLGAEVEFAADEAVLPLGVDLEAGCQEAGVASVIGAADEDGLGVGVVGEAFWRPLEAPGSGFLTLLGFEVMGEDKAGGAAAQLGGGGVVEALPDFILPEAVEGLDLVLKAVLAGRSEDGGDAQSQTEEGDGAEAVGVVMGAVKAQVVVELGVGGQTVLAPMGQQGIAGELGGDGGAEEAAAKAAMQGDDVEDLDFTAALDDQSLDHIPGIQFGAGGGEVREVPPWRGWGATQATGVFDEAAALEHVGNGGTAGQGPAGRRLGAQGAKDGHGTIFTQGITMTESVAQVEDALDHWSGQGVSRLMRGVRVVREIDPVESASARSCDPVLHARKGDPELAGDLPQADAPAGEEDQLAAITIKEFFMLGRVAGARRAASSVPAPLRSASTTLAARPVSFRMTQLPRSDQDHRGLH